MYNLYVNHSKNGLYVLMNSEDKENINPTYDLEYIDDGKKLSESHIYLIPRNRNKLIRYLYDNIFDQDDNDIFLTTFSSKMYNNQDYDLSKGIKISDIEYQKQYIEDMYYEGAELEVFLKKHFIEIMKNRQGMIFKKFENNVPYGLWLLSKTMNTQIKNYICRLLFDANIF